MRRALAGLLLLGAAVTAGVPGSGATFTAGAANPGATFSAAADFNTVAVSLSNPGSPLRGSVPLAATAASDRGITSVTFRRAPAGSGTWTTVCTDNDQPYSCALDTTAVADGLYDVKAVALDSAGYSRESSVGARRFDNTAPSPSATVPAGPLAGTGVALGATATDAGSGLKTLKIEVRPDGGSWSTVCSQATSPANCSWNSMSVPDGLYHVRSAAEDNAGNTADSTTVSRRVDNVAPTVTMTDPGPYLRGNVTLQSTSSDGNGTGVTSVRYEYKLTSGGGWTTACTAGSAPFSCNWNASALNNTYDLRAVATDGFPRSTTSAVVAGRVVDNIAPTSATLNNLGTPLQGTVNLGASAGPAADVASVRFERSPAGAGNWTTICTDNATPYTCTFDTTAVPDARYDLRVVAADLAGNTLNSAALTNRVVDNNGPTVTLADPGSPRRATVALSADATDVSGVQSVQFAYKLTSADTWTAINTDTTGNPYTVNWNTSSLNGTYDLRALATDTLGRTSTSIVTARVVDNTKPRGTAVQGVNGGTAGKLDAGDRLTFTWSEQLAPSSVLDGWDGAPKPVAIRVTDLFGIVEFIGIYDETNTSRVQLGDLVNWGDTVVSTSVLDGTIEQTGTTITVTVGAPRSGEVQSNAAGGTTTWAPSANATDLAGNTASTTGVTGNIDF